MSPQINSEIFIIIKHLQFEVIMIAGSQSYMSLIVSIDLKYLFNISIWILLRLSSNIISFSTLELLLYQSIRFAYFLAIVSTLFIDSIIN